MQRARGFRPQPVAPSAVRRARADSGLSYPAGFSTAAVPYGTVRACLGVRPVSHHLSAGREPVPTTSNLDDAAPASGSLRNPRSLTAPASPPAPLFFHPPGGKADSGARSAPGPTCIEWPTVPVAPPVVQVPGQMALDFDAPADDPRAEAYRLARRAKVEPPDALRSARYVTTYDGDTTIVAKVTHHGDGRIVVSDVRPAAEATDAERAGREIGMEGRADRKAVRHE